MPSGVYERPTLEERFWSKIDIKSENECWEWTAYKNKYGYGVISVNGKMLLSHRVAWELTKEPIPEGEGFHGTCVLHKCDNRLCVNPNHLFLGSQDDNIKDMISKNRQATQKGEKHGRSILTEKQVLAIRQDKRLNREIAEEYEVEKSTIGYIKCGKRWKHI